ncbi:TPA: hypothetical protein DCX16_00090 [bacterium]|nr:hypothetical protein [bacterium]
MKNFHKGGDQDGYYCIIKIRKISNKKARELVRKVLNENSGNISKTARILKILRNERMWIDI